MSMSYDMLKKRAEEMITFYETEYCKYQAANPDYAYQCISKRNALVDLVDE